MWVAFLERDERRWDLFLLFFAIVGHAYSLVVTGAKFWIDSIVYFQLALALFDAEQLGRLYNAQFGFLYQHSSIGLSFLIRALNAVFHERLWPVLATFQYFISAVAVTYFVLAFRMKLSRPAQFAAVVLCSLHPYFTSFHGAALTESVAASLLLASLGIAIRALDGRISLRASLCLLLPLSILAMQFRPYLGAAGMLMAALIVLQRGESRRIVLLVVTAVAMAVGTFVFPAYRAALGAGFFLPNVSALLLTHVSYVSLDLDNEAAQALNSVVLNDAIRARLIGKEPFDYGDARHVFDDLVSSGVTAAEARRKIAAAAWQVRTSSFRFIERQLQLPLASVGLQIAPACCVAGRQLTRDLTASDMFHHIRRYYRWNSGLADSSYVDTFDIFSQMTRSSQIYADEVEKFYIARIRPYVTDALKPFRDPLHLTWFVTDPFVIVAWFGLFLFFWPAQRTTLLVLSLPFAVIYGTVVFTHVFGDNRHAHPLIPIIIVGAAKVADDFFRGTWSRLRALELFSGSKMRSSVRHDA